MAVEEEEDHRLTQCRHTYVPSLIIANLRLAAFYQAHIVHLLICQPGGIQLSNKGSHWLPIKHSVCCVTGTQPAGSTTLHTSSSICLHLLEVMMMVMVVSVSTIIVSSTKVCITY